MARKRTRISYMPRSRCNSSKTRTDSQMAAVEESHEGDQTISITEPVISAKSPLSEADDNDKEQSANKTEGVLSPDTSKPKSKRRSTRIEYRTRSRRRNRSNSNTQSQSSSETLISMQRRGKTNQHGNPEETANKTSLNSEQQKGKKRTKQDSEEVQSFSNSISGQRRGRKSSRNSADENDTERTAEQIVVAVSTGTNAAKVKRTKRKSTRVAYRPRSSSKGSKQKKQKVSDDSSTSGKQTGNSMPKRQTYKKVAKTDSHPGDTSESLSAASDVDDTSKKTANICNKPQAQEKKRKRALQVKATSAADQNTKLTSDAKKRTTQQRKAEQKNQKEEIPDRIRDMTVTKKAYSRWKPLQSSTKDHVKETIESTILSVLNVISSKAGTRRDVQKYLQTLKQRIFTRLQTIKGPTNQLDYSSIEAQLKILEDSVLSNNSQVEVLENELEVQKRLLQEGREQLQSFTAGGDQNMGAVDPIDRSKLHRLLRSEPVNTLNLPRLPKESFERPIPKFSAEIQEMSKQLSQAVTDITERAEAVEVPQWLEYFAQLSDTLPAHSS